MKHSSWSIVLISALLALICVPGGTVYRIPVPAYVYPLMSPRLSSSFGPRHHPIYKARRHHNGVDLAAPTGAPIRAIAEGQVVFADPYAGYGNLVVVRHEDGMTSHYGHCNKLKVKPGQRVAAGEIIATVGATGKVTGPHLHFEIRLHGEPRNPDKYLPGLAQKAAG